MTKALAKRIAAIKAMNPVNAGLLYAATELERADAAERKAWSVMQLALMEFHRCERLTAASTQRQDTQADIYQQCYINDRRPKS